MVIVIIPLMLVSTGAAFASGLKDIAKDKTVMDLAHSRAPIVIWLVACALCDFMNAVCMVCVIYASRKRIRVVGSGSLRTEAQLALAVRLSLETNALTMAGALIKLIFFFVYPNSRLFPMMGFINSKLYSNSLMVSLNSRPSGQTRDPTLLKQSAGAATSERRMSVLVSSSETRSKPGMLMVTRTIEHESDAIDMDNHKQGYAGSETP